jgi:hypothetical protein
MPSSLSAIDADFADVLPFLKARGIVPASPPAGQIENARKIHRTTYSLILWRFRLKRIPEHGRVFLEEIASDALQVLPQVLMGYGKTTSLLIRGIIENALRHVYFCDHPIEFARMNRDGRWYIRMEDLRDYAKIHPSFLRTELKFDAMNKLNILYDQLSAKVHGRNVENLEMHVALRKIRYEEEAARKHVQLIARCAESTNFLLAVFHGAKMAVFDQEDRRLILRTMCKKARRAWMER